MPTFKTPAQEAVYGISQIWLKQMFHDAVLASEQEPSFMTRIGATTVLTTIRIWQNPFGEDDAIIQNRAYIVRGAEVTLLLTRNLAERNSEMLFGGFGLDGTDVFFGHSIVGSTCDRLELRSSVAAVANSVIQFHDEILQRAGGQSALNE